MKVLMVCLGNICRSPLAEGILRQVAKENNVKIEVDSCGTAAYHIGKHPDQRSIDVAKKNKLDISSLSGRQFQKLDFVRFDKIYVMDKANLSDVLKLAENDSQKQKVQLLGEELEAHLEVPDPYYGDLQGFEDLYVMLHQACTNVVSKLK